MHQNSKNKHIAKLKFLKIGDQSSASSSQASQTNSIENESKKKSIQSEIDSMVTHDESSVDKNNQDKSQVKGKSGFLDKFKKIKDPIQNKLDKSVSSVSEVKMPSFLQNIFPSKGVEENNSIEEEVIPEDDLKLLPFASSQQETNPNSISSIFNKDHQEVFGIQRVFRKSIIFLVLHLLSFSVLGFIGLNIFTLPILLTFLVSISYIVFTNIFYIIVADRSYVWLSLLGQGILLLIINAFVGQSFDRVTLVLVLLISMFTYYAYSELEKVQLSSRLFSISHITTESIRILITVVILVLSLGVFNKSLSQGSADYISEAFLDKPVILDNLVLGRYKNFSLNRYLMKGRFYLDSGKLRSDLVRPANKTTFVFSEFLTLNYRSSEIVLSEERQEQILADCDTTAVENCASLVDAEKQSNLDAWRKEAYGNLPFTLDTELTPTRFKAVTKQFYINEIEKFNSDSSNQSGSDITETLSRYLIVPRTYIVPAFLALILFILLTFIVKPILQLVSFWFTFLVWKILVWFGFAKINIERVEAEIVSI